MSLQRMSVRIRGKVYPDAYVAAKELGVALSTVYCGISRGNPERIGLGPDYKSRKTAGGKAPKPVTVAGYKFASMAELARAIGRKPKAVRVSLKSGEIAKQRIITAVMHWVSKQDNAAMKAAFKAQLKDQP